MLRLENAERNTYYSNIRQRSWVYASYCMLACIALLASSYLPAAVAASQYQLPSKDISSISLALRDSKRKTRLLNYSMICIDNSTVVSNRYSNQSVEINDPGSNRHVITDELTESDLESILLDIEDSSTARRLAPVGVLTLHPMDMYRQEKPDKTLHGGSALGAVLRMSLKSWWKHNQGSQLHALSNHAPTTIKNGGFSGRAKYDWDYKLKLTHDDVKLKLEKVF